MAARAAAHGSSANSASRCSRLLSCMLSCSCEDLAWIELVIYLAPFPLWLYATLAVDEKSRVRLTNVLLLPVARRAFEGGNARLYARDGALREASRPHKVQRASRSSFCAVVYCSGHWTDRSGFGAIVRPAAHLSLATSADLPHWPGCQRGDAANWVSVLPLLFGDAVIAARAFHHRHKSAPLRRGLRRVCKLYEAQNWVT